ncbi:hypothetical protein H0H93_011399 [Arthromyces matolae]|nr:hypothetical protein H0H93_011399 [Arthromyces matolae]
MHKIPDVPPTIASLLQEFIGPQIVRNIDLEPEVHEYDREPRVADFHIPLPPEDHTVVTSGSNSSERSALKEKRKILGHHIKRHLLTLLRKARQPERVTTDQVKHARIRVMQLWVLITENDLKLLGSQPLDSSLFLEGNIVGRSIGADGVVRERNNRYRDEEKKVATECFNYYKQVMTAYGFLRWYTSYEGRVGTGSNMFNILSNFFGNHLPIHPTSAPHTPK